MFRVAFVLFLIVLWPFANCGNAEEILWRFPPGQTMLSPDTITDKEESGGSGFGPGLRQYLLSRIVVGDVPNPNLGQAGTINQVITFFSEIDEGGQVVDFSGIPGAAFNPETGFFEIAGTARLNVFEVSPLEPLPSPQDEPAEGVAVPAVFVHNTVNGWIEVRAGDLEAQVSKIDPKFPLQLERDGEFFVGLTPIFTSIDDQPFTGEHLTNIAPLVGEGVSAFRQRTPVDANWMAALDGQGADLFSAIVIRGRPEILVGDVNCDGAINLLDVAPFVAQIANGVFSEKADINGDGMVDLLDVTPFIALLANP